MKIYILNYKESYTGGSVVVIAKNENRLKELLRNSSEYITDKIDVEIYNKLIKPVYETFDGGLSAENFKLIFKTLSYDLQKKIENVKKDLYCTHNGFIRIDWLIMALNPKQGLYLVESYDVSDSLEERIVTDTYYCA